MRTTNLYYNNYISNCDLINKYNCTNINTIPKIKSIVLEIPLFQFITLLNISLNSKNTIIKTYLKAYFMFYILFSLEPYINYKSTKKLDKNYSLKLKLSNINQINNFSHTFFMHFTSNSFFNFFFNFKNLEIKDVKNTNVIKNKFFNNLNDKTILKKKYINNFKDINFNLKIPVFCFHLLNFYIDFFFESINSKELFFYINYVVNSYNLTNDNANLLKNLQNFWVFK